MSWCLLVTLGMPSPTLAAPPTLVLTPVRSSLVSANSIQARLLAHLARGDIAGALVMYEAQTGVSWEQVVTP